MTDGSESDTQIQTAGLDRDQLRKSLESWRVADQITPPEDAVAKLAREKEEAKDTSLKQTRSLSEQLPQKVVKFERGTSTLSRITAGIPQSVEGGVLDTMDRSKAQFEPVIYMQAGMASGPEFLPAIVAHDTTTDETYTNNHVAICDIGPSVVLEEVVRDPTDQEKVLDIRYWVKSAKSDVLEKAANAKWGRAPAEPEVPGNVADVDKPEAETEFKYADPTNKLLRPPLVLEQISGETALDDVSHKGKVIVRYDDLLQPERGYAKLNSITEKRQKLKPLQPLNVPNAPQDASGIKQSGEDTVIDTSDNFGPPERNMVTTEVDKSAGMKITIGGVEYTKTLVPKGKNTEAIYRTQDGDELNQDQMINEIRNHRIGQVRREDRGDLYWDVPEAHIKPLVGEAVLWKADVPVVKENVDVNPSEEILIALDTEGLVLANTEELARQGVFKVKIVDGETSLYEGNADEQKTNQALDKVAQLVGEHSANFTIGNISDTDGLKYDIKFTQFLSSDGKRVVTVEERDEKAKTTVRQIRLVDDDTAQKWSSEYAEKGFDPLWLGQIIDSVKSGNGNENVHQVLSKIDSVIGVQQ